MGFISSVGHALSTAAQGASDTIVLGPMGPVYRKQLESEQEELTTLIGQYSHLNKLVTSYEDPINNVGKYTSNLLHHSSDYVHGIAVNYDAILSAGTYENANIQRLADSNVIKPLIDLPIPGTMGGIPSALIPGVEALKIVTGLINMFGSSATLPAQIAKARHHIDEAHRYIAHEQDTLTSLKSVGSYLIQVDNQLLGLFQQTCGVEMPQLSASSSDTLAHAAKSFPDLIAKVESLKGNAFRTVRFIQNVISAKKIKTFDDAQKAFIVSALMNDGKIAAAFGKPDSLRHFVDQFLDGTLLSKGLLTLPPVPNRIKGFLNEGSAAKQAYSDPNSSAFDPPDTSLNGFPT
ncbi:MAG TPA: hypothetical protein VKA18_05405 [Alphaproteobacteria bacterium]|nr:hypothetical protein [Alphaproteobacteria bacterium]